MSKAGIATILAILLAAGASAQTRERDAQAERRIEQQLAAISPDSVAPFHEATVALDRQNYAEAVRLYREVLRNAARFSPAIVGARGEPRFGDMIPNHP